MIKKIIIGLLLILIALAGAVFYALPFFIDKEAIKEALVASFKAHTGFELEVEGEVTLQRFPTPHIVVNSMYVHNAQGGIEPFLLTIKIVEIWPSYKTFFSKHPAIQKINIDNVDVELEHLKNDQMNWRDSSVQTPLPVGVGESDPAGIVGAYINITNGYIRYTDEVTNNSTEYKDISLSFLNGGAQSESSINAKVTYADKPLSIFGNIGSIPKAISVGEVPAALLIKSDKSELKYQGNVGYRDGKVAINGSLKFITDDIVSWIGVVLDISDKNIANASSYKPLPLQAKTDIVSDNGKIILPNLNLDGAIIKGNTHIEFSPPYGVDVKGELNLLDLETLFASKLFALKEVVDPLKERENAQSKEAAFIVAPKTLLNSLNLSTDLKIDDTLYNQQHIKDTHVQFDMSDGEMTISQASAALAGDTKVIFTGIGKESYQGFALEGQVDSSGADFSEAIKVLKANGAAFPVQDFKRFHFKANAILSPKELRFSEISARIENMAFVGGFITSFGERIKVDAAMRIGNLNLDHFVQVWGIPEWRTSLFDMTPGAKYDTFLARWLKRLDYDATMNIVLEQFTLNDHLHDKADFRLAASQGRVALTNVTTNYNGSNIVGSFALDVTNTLPKIDLKATIDTLDYDKFFGITPEPAPAAKSDAENASQPASADADTPRWSRKEFDFHWLELLAANFHLKFGEYTQGPINAHSLDIQGSIDNNKFSIDTMTGYVMGAQLAGRASIIGGKIPSIILAANINAVDPVQLIPFLPVLQGMTGKYNLSLRLDTSGIDMNSWISSLEGSIGVGGQNVNIHGFNLAGVIHAVGYVRTVADILNVVRRAFPGGDTMFSTIEGQWTVSGGVLKTSNSKLNNEQADGVLTSQVDLANWRIQSSINLLLKSLDVQHPPGMIITFSGDLDKPDTALDTRSLEQYVTNKTSQRMLQEYGIQQ